MANIKFHLQKDKKETRLSHLKELLSKEYFLNLVDNSKKREATIVLWYEGIKNLKYLEEFENSQIDKVSIEDGIIVPLSLKAELFNNQNVYPLYLEEGKNHTEIFTLKENDYTKFQLIATSKGNKGSFPSIILKKIKNTNILAIGFPFCNSNGENNLWKAYCNLFLSNLNDFFLKKNKTNPKFWKYHLSKFDNLPFILPEKKPLTTKKALNLKKITKTEKGVCKNEKILMKIEYNKGKIIAPPLEIITNLILDNDPNIKYTNFSHVIKISTQNNNFEGLFFPASKDPSIFLFLSPQSKKEFSLSYKLHFKPKSPYPEFLFSKINYFKPSGTLFIAHTSDMKAIFLNRYSKEPESITIEKEDSITPALKIHLSFILNRGEFLLMQFSSIYKEKMIKKAEISSLLGAFKKKYFEESIIKKELKSLRVIQSKGEKRINLEKMARDLTNNIFVNSEGKTVFFNVDKKIEKKEFLEALTNLVILGYENRVEEIIKDLYDYKRIPFIIYPSGEIVFDYREKEVSRLNRVSLNLKAIKEEIYDNAYINSFLKKRFSSLKELNFKGMEFWNNELQNPETLYFKILNPINTEKHIVFAPLIPLFIKYISFKNIRVGAHLFDFTFKRNLNTINIEFKNNTKKPFTINFFPLIMNEGRKFEINLEKRVKINFQIDRKYLIYSEHYEFQSPPHIESNEEKLKLSFDKITNKKIIYLTIEIYDCSIKKLVGARLFKGKRKEEERIIIYEPEKSNYIYMYFRPQKKQKKLFNKNNI